MGPQNAKDLRSWSCDSLKFFCMCSFNGALQRKENKLPITYRILIPELEHMSSNGEKDVVSVEILIMYNSAILRDLVPMSVCGDGNCLYRAVSRTLTSSKNFHELLRL
ncbi:hypothetical protein ACJMK2_011097 [Sinanodonta woodiana]|uniref:OTU domain-containing protein n=1 Tax=Sinanodonta woodiana TaxID=1069815 RepID=A0ABD3V684_SINWO